MCIRLLQPDAPFWTSRIASLQHWKVPGYVVQKRWKTAVQHMTGNLQEFLFPHLHEHLEEYKRNLLVLKGGFSVSFGEQHEPEARWVVFNWLSFQSDCWGLGKYHSFLCAVKMAISLYSEFILKGTSLLLFCCLGAPKGRWEQQMKLLRLNILIGIWLTTPDKILAVVSYSAI